MSLKASWSEEASSTLPTWQKSGKNGILFMKLSLYITISEHVYIVEVTYP